MNDSQHRPGIFRQFIERFSGNPKKSIFNPRDIDELVDRINALGNITITVGTKNKAHLGARGMLLELNVPSAATPDGTSVTAFAISALSGGDYFTARELKNFRLIAGIPSADIDSADVKIAKPVHIRRSVILEMWDGNPVTYRNGTNTGLDGFDDNNRIANDGSDDEVQVVYPRYITYADLGLASPINVLTSQCVIFATQPTNGTGVFDETGMAISWLEDESSRVWAKRFAA